jgi:hypothetical protein
MELITYDAQNSPSRRSEEPAIRFCKSGLFTINPSAAEKLSLESGSQVVFHQDKKKKSDWYLEKRTANGLKLRINKTSKSRSLVCNCSLVCKEVLASLGKTSRVAIPIAITPIDGKYFALLTSTLK